jgi:spermidine/putrescine transport system permease protein
MTQAALDTDSSSLPSTFKADPALSVGKLRRDLAIRRVGRVILTLTPWLAYLFLWIPILVLIVFSFNDSRANAVWRGFTLRWYEGLIAGQFGDQPNFNTTNLMAALQRSLIVGVVSTAISTALGTMVALGLERYRVRGKRLIEMLMYLPVVIPEITMGLSLLIFFSASFGVARRAFGLDLALNLVTIIIGHVVFSLPFVAIAVRARLSGMTRSLEEAARDLGADEWRTFTRVTLPLLMPGILAGALLAFTLSLDDFIITFFTQGPGTTTLPLFVYGMIKFQITPDINAISTLMVAVSIALVTASLWLQRNRT